jgi:uncharacterized membrane protein YdjX (TVP38/TMEM64 family)
VTRVLALLVVLACLLATGLAALHPDVRAGVGHLVDLLASGDRAGVRDYLRSFGVWAPVVSALLVQVQAVVAPLPSFPLMYANGLLFGIWWGGLLSWVSILLSAGLCFGLARLFGRPVVERFVTPAALAWADRHLARYGPFAVFIGRLLPVTSFDLISYASGLTRMRLVPFCLATGIGMAPAVFLTAALADLGWSGPWGWAAGLAGIGVLAGLVVWLRPSVLRWLEGRDAGRSAPARASAVAAEILGQPLAEKEPRPVDARLHGRQADAEQLRDLRVGQPLHVVEDERRPVVGR